MAWQSWSWLHGLMMTVAGGGGGGGCVMSCYGGCMAWRSWSHGLMVAMVGGGYGGHSHITEAAVVMLRHVAVAAWHGGCGCMA
jgi:hypothetical protein